MRPLFLGSAPDRKRDPDAYFLWLENALREITEASYEGVETVAPDYTVENYDEALHSLRTLDVTTATATEIREVLGTLLRDLKNLGTKRGNQ